ncbi:MULTISPECIES: efflux RND transporter periplasmic adaptor subunit [Vibrio]|uniref:HlyD family secretion protein n=1 Tax=Vibrio ostreae TaxID=2841925 RepID=A0A975YLA5_9VIBR|nr:MULTISPECIES: HlyD family secretion protein [Vibrio]QXO15438.1 HlyD family secretion protein [Vibrio ostreae]WGY45381.1 HlyD family secretion protein [Vibrio sp. ABG19]
MGKVLRICLTLAVVIIAVIAGHWVWDHYLYSPWTRDGRIRAQVITIAPDVSGWVDTLNVQDNQQVSKGELIFSVDPTRYAAKIKELEAEVENKQYALDLERHRYVRRQQLTGKNLISEETVESARINTELAKASLDIAKAQLNTAQINLDRTQIHAPADGTLINLNLREGNYVSQGSSVLSLVKKDSFYVTGYFEETKLPMIKVGQSAKITLMSGGKPLTGKVVSIGKAIADTNTSSNGQLLPQVQQTFNWVRLAQRIPVDIKLDPLDENVNISAGMTVSIYLQEAE